MFPSPLCNPLSPLLSFSSTQRECWAEVIMERDDILLERRHDDMRLSSCFLAKFLDESIVSILH